MGKAKNHLNSKHQPKTQPWSTTVCCASDECGWSGPRSRRTKALMLMKPCPRCGGPVFAPTRKNRARKAAEKRLINQLPESKRKLIKDVDITAIRKELNEVTIGETVALIERGNFPVTAAVAAGIPKQDFEKWMDQGRRDWAQQKETIFAAFYIKVEQSQAIAEAQLVDKGLEKIEKNHSTWMGCYRHLESVSRDRWLKTQQIDINSTAKVEHSIDVPPEPPQSHEEWMERKLARAAQEAEFEIVEDAPA